MKLLRILLEMFMAARQARDEARRKLRSIEENGGLKMPCGCFIRMQAADAHSIAARVSPQELLRVVESLEESHLSECGL